MPEFIDRADDQILLNLLTLSQLSGTSCNYLVNVKLLDSWIPLTVDFQIGTIAGCLISTLIFHKFIANTDAACIISPR
jgi:hypothetical protein